MKEVHFATKNKGKVESVRNALSKYRISVVHHSLELPEPRSDDLKEIAKQKVLHAHYHIKAPCIAIDSGFYVHSLNGFPRAFVNFALETIGIEGILKLAEGKSRTCEFRNCLAYTDDSLQEPLYFESNMPGALSKTARGKTRDYQWSELFHIVIPQGKEETLAEMSPDKYLKWRETRLEDSFTKKFAEWFSQR